MTNGELIDILSKSPRDKKVILTCKPKFFEENDQIEIGHICEYDNQIEIEPKQLQL